MKKLRGIFKSLKRMQNLWKVRTEQKNYQMIRRKIIKVQRWIRKRLYKISVMKKRKNVMVIQTYLLRYLAKKTNHQILIKNIMILQRAFKQGIEKMKAMKYKGIKHFFLVIQFCLFFIKNHV